MRANSSGEQWVRPAWRCSLLDALVSAREFPEFLTLGAYEKLE